MKIRDIIIVVAVLCVSVLLGFVPISCGGEGDVFTVNDAGKITEYPLSADRTVVLEHATVVVEGGTVRVEKSDCKDKVCENFGSISKAGESIICIPNRLYITVNGTGEVDSVAE